jgi:GH15 family glucan-1,4-alpha-glucosidase
LELRAQERVWFALRWDQDADEPSRAPVPEHLGQTAQCWRRWVERVDYDGPQSRLVRRSALTPKLLDYAPHGALVAAPTSSLPEVLRGPRNWDYRYTWIRDAAFSVYALRRIGLHREGASFLAWVMNLVHRGERPRVLYDLDGHAPPPEHEDRELEGYGGSHPVRWGNAAADQRQHDMYGEILDCAYQWARHEGAPGEQLWEGLRFCVERARQVWDRPDQGIWEMRSTGRPYTYSAALCQVALDRGWRLCERYGLPGDEAAWRESAQAIREALLERAWSERRKAFASHLGGEELDASVLSLPLRRVIAAEHPKMVATARAIETELGAGGGLLYRYLPEKLSDGLPGREGAFLLCSFWLVDNYTNRGLVDQAMQLYESLCARASPLGLLPEQIAPASGAFLGNYPQAFSHVGVISSGINLARQLGGAQL